MIEWLKFAAWPPTETCGISRALNARSLARADASTSRDASAESPCFCASATASVRVRAPARAPQLELALRSGHVGCWARADAPPSATRASDTIPRPRLRTDCMIVRLEERPP